MEKINNIKKEIENLLPLMVKEIQKIYDEWTQDDYGVDEILGTGGICDQISQKTGEILAQHGFDIVEGGMDGDDHAFIIAIKNKTAFIVDIPPYVYETGGGYSWKKRPNVVFSPKDFDVVKTEYEYFKIEENLFNKLYNQILKETIDIHHKKI